MRTIETPRRVIRRRLGQAVEVNHPVRRLWTPGGRLVLPIMGGSGTDFVFNIAKGSIAEKIRDGANLGLLILRTTGIEADGTLKDYTLISTLLAAANDEATNTNYARKTVSNAGVTLTVDNTGDQVSVDFADQTWSGVAAGDAWAKAIIYEDVGGADSSRVPLTAHSFDITPDGSDVVAVVAAGPPAGFFKAT